MLFCLPCVALETGRTGFPLHRAGGPGGIQDLGKTDQDLYLKVKVVHGYACRDIN